MGQFKFNVGQSVDPTFTRTYTLMLRQCITQHSPNINRRFTEGCPNASVFTGLYYTRTLKLVYNVQMLFTRVFTLLCSVLL